MPLRAQATGVHAGSLPSDGSFLHVGNPSFVVSAVKETEDRCGWIVRGYNVGDEAIDVKLRPWRKFATVERANLAEEATGKLEVGESGEVMLSVKGHEIATIKFCE